jgi:hypothetical protein
MEDEDEGAFLIYNFNADALSVTNAWRGHLAANYPDLEFDYDEAKLDFSTKSIHVRSGRPFYVTHFNIPLHHDPVDRNM